MVLVNSHIDAIAICLIRDGDFHCKHLHKDQELSRVCLVPHNCLCVMHNSLIPDSSGGQGFTHLMLGVTCQSSCTKQAILCSQVLLWDGQSSRCPQDTLVNPHMHECFTLSPELVQAWF